MLYIVTFKKGKRQGRLFTEYEMIRIISVLALDKDQALKKAIVAAGLKNLDSVEVSVI
jgi:hypothetical protein